VNKNIEPYELNLYDLQSRPSTNRTQENRQTERTICRVGHQRIVHRITDRPKVRFAE